MAQGSAPVDTVLIVDDDPVVVDMVRGVLLDGGYRLISAADGRSALEIAKAEQPDLMLLDWLMPGMTGIEVCEALRKDSDPKVRDIIIVMLTAQRTVGQIKVVYEAKANDYLPKPLVPAELQQRVRQWLAWAHQRQS